MRISASVNRPRARPSRVYLGAPSPCSSIHIDFDDLASYARRDAVGPARPWPRRVDPDDRRRETAGDVPRERHGFSS